MGGRAANAVGVLQVPKRGLTRKLNGLHPTGLSSFGKVAGVPSVEKKEHNEWAVWWGFPGFELLFACIM